LDLTDPTSLREAEGLLEALDAPLGGFARASERLRSRIDEAGVTEARVYDVEGDRSGAGVHLAKGVEVGGEISDATDDARLVAAQVRGPDGAWRSRSECLAG
jgi:hypothetical protein